MVQQASASNSTRLQESELRRRNEARMDELVAQGAKEHQPLRCEGRGSQPVRCRGVVPSKPPSRKFPQWMSYAASFVLLGF